MRILHIISLVLCLSSIQGYPTRPLDDIARNLTWDEAWDGDEMTRKKVVPKSVFIAPDFGSPKCPSGHERDSMGNCIKLHSLDADSQLNFLFEKILAGLPPSDVDTPDPVRLNVPIDHTESIDDKVNLALVFTKDQNEDDIAVVVSPTNGSFSPDKLSLHKDVEQPDPGEVNTTTEEATITTTTITTTQEEDIQPSTPPITTSFTTDQITDTTQFQTTTIYPTTTTDTSTTIETTSQAVTDTTYTITSNSGDDMSTTTEIFDEDVDFGQIVEPQAIFFRMPTMETVEDAMETTVETTTMSNRDYSTNYVSSNIVFPDAEHVRQSSNFVSFVDDEDAKKRPQRHDNSPELFYFSHRNRDKNFWRFLDRRDTSVATTEEKSSQLFKQLQQLSHILNKRKSR